MRFRIDSSWVRLSPQSLLAGSPLTQFTVTDRGVDVLDALERGAEIARSSLTERLLDAGAIHPALPPDTPPTAGSADRWTNVVTVVTPQFGGQIDTAGPPTRLVVDDASTPPIGGAALRLAHNVGPGGARNAGRRRVSTPFVLFLDADVEVAALTSDDTTATRWWNTLLHHFDDPRVGLVAPRVIGDAGSSLDLGGEPARIRAGTRVSYVPAAAMLVRLDAFDHVGGFDPALRVGEDVDFVWRLDEAGWRCRYEPAVTVAHRPRATLLERLGQQVKYGASSGPLALRHPDALTPWRANPWSAAILVALLARRPLVAVATAAVSTAVFTRRVPSLPRRTAAALVLRGHLNAGEQLPVAIRRVWWPLVALAATRSTRGRLLALTAVLLSPRTTLHDAAFGVGVWRSVIATRTLAPVLPQVGGQGLRHSTASAGGREAQVGDRSEVER